MIKTINFSILVVLLLLSSCKKQVVKMVSKNNLEAGLYSKNQTLEDSAGGGAEAFSPVTDVKAKQFVRDLDINSSQKLDISSGQKNNSNQNQVSFSGQAPANQDQEVYASQYAPLNQDNLSNQVPVDNFGQDKLFVQDGQDIGVINQVQQILTEDEEEFQSSKDKINNAELIRQKEAKLSDIPIPISSEPLIEYFKFKNSSKGEIVLGYSSSMDIDSVVDFYNQEMEFLGWESGSFFNGIEKLMLFKKPSRLCSISIRDFKNRSRSKKNSRDCKCEIIISVKS